MAAARCGRSWRAFLLLLLTAMLVAEGTGCSRIKAKLERLAKAGKPEPVSPQETPLTPEEERMNARLNDPKLFEGAAPDDEVPKAQPFELNKSSVVAILGYHDFRDRGGSPMLISAPKFREQMQAIKDSGIPVIPLSDLVAWKRGTKNIPEEAIVITMDDGWEGVYQYAFPVLKEFGFPFTFYLYKKYVNIGGRSMSYDQIKEMLAFGAEVGSHSVSHEDLKARRGRDDTDYQQWVLAELRDSKAFIEEKLGVRCTSFAYPFGSFNEDIMETTMQVGYDTAVTVNNQKVAWDTPLGKLGRYIIHGENDTNFKLATSFRGRGDVSSSHMLMADAKDDQGQKLVELSPEPDQVITDRRPVIQANLGKLGPIVPDSVKVRVSGLGVVPAEYDPATGRIRYQLPYKLRREECFVSIHFKRDPAQPEEVLQWRFKLNLAASYVPRVTEAPMQPAEPAPAPAGRG